MTTLTKEPKTSILIDAAKQTLNKASEGIQALYSVIDDKFVTLIDQLLTNKGRLILSGMGKSGHIAQKIAATLSSTGTPALFVHPGEASHGDLGMITKNDMVLLLSNSGETAELKDIIYYTKRFAIPLFAIVRRKNSILVDSADIALILPEISEASPINAPTTSSTMMLALGDAIAIALLQARGFNKDDFKLLHPGGKLGSALIKVSDVMHHDAEIPAIAQDTPMAETLRIMTDKGFGCVAITNQDDELQGLITDGDLRRHIDEKLLSKTASDIMTCNPITITPDALAVEALQIMDTYSITNLFVVEQKKILGIIHIHDCLKAGIA